MDFRPYIIRKKKMLVLSICFAVQAVPFSFFSSSHITKDSLLYYKQYPQYFYYIEYKKSKVHYSCLITSSVGSKFADNWSVYISTSNLTSLNTFWINSVTSFLSSPPSPQPSIGNAINGTG